MKLLYVGPEVPSHLKNQDVLHLPLIATFPLNTVIDVQALEECTHAIFTSPRAVVFLVEAMNKQSISLEVFKDKEIVAVGPSTTEKLSSLIDVSAKYPKSYCQEGVLELLQDLPLKSCIFFPKAKVTRPLIEEFLKERKIACYCLELYETKILVQESLPDLCDIEAIYFSSPSTVRGFLENFGKIPEDKKILVAGAVTAAELEKAGFGDRIAT